jgi:TetR/AcrR family transcriptional regulator, transcriptional repressor for nem operon
MGRDGCAGVEAAGSPGDALTWGGSTLCGLASLEDLVRWRDEVVAVHRTLILDASAVPDATRHGCDGDGSSVARPVAISTVRAWLVAGFERMRKNGELAVDADPARLATSLTAALRGGSLLARASRDVTRLEAALDLALSCVHAHSAR